LQLARFAEADRVSFTANDGTNKSGRIMRLHEKTDSLLADDGQQ
jgi:hypothetical protein